MKAKVGSDSIGTTALGGGWNMKAESKKYYLNSVKKLML